MYFHQSFSILQSASAQKNKSLLNPGFSKLVYYVHGFEINLDFQRQDGSWSQSNRIVFVPTMNNIRDNLTCHNGCNVNEYFVSAKTDLNLVEKLTYLPSLFKIQGVRKVKKIFWLLTISFPRVGENVYWSCKCSK